MSRERLIQENKVKIGWIAVAVPSMVLVDLEGAIVATIGLILIGWLAAVVR